MDKQLLKQMKEDLTEEATLLLWMQTETAHLMAVLCHIECEEYDRGFAAWSEFVVWTYNKKSRCYVHGAYYTVAPKDLRTHLQAALDDFESRR